MTNYEKIKSMSVEEFMEEITLNAPIKDWCAFVFGSWRNCENLKEWLNKEVTE